MKSLANVNQVEKPVIVNIWLPDSGGYGHVSLRIDDDHYVSFWPILSGVGGLKGRKENVRAGVLGVRGIFTKSKKVDTHSEKQNKHPEAKYKIYGLNSRKMIEKYEEIKEGVERGKILWSLSESLCSIGTTSYNCSKLTMKLLREGGIQSRLPSDAQFGTLSHLTLLCSSRVYITISFLACGLYPVLDDMATDNSHSRSIMATLLMVFLSNSMIFILEKKLRDTSLKEINKDDYIVGIGSSLGFGSVALLHKWLERTKITNVILQCLNMDKFLDKAIFDAIFLLPGTLFGLYAGGKIASFLITFSDCGCHCRGMTCTISGCSCCHRGTTYTASPTNVYEWLDYVEKTKNIPKEAVHFVNKTNRVSLLILYTGWIACFLARNGFFVGDSKNFFGAGLNLESGIPALYIGLPTGIMFGYALTKCYMKKYIQEIKKLEDKNYKIGDEYQIIVSKNFNIEQYQYLGKYSFTTATTLLGLMMVISIFDFFSLNDHIMEKGVLSPFGAVGGFLCGSSFFDLCQNYLKKYGQKPETLPSDKKQTNTYIDEAELKLLLNNKNTRIPTSYESHKLYDGSNKIMAFAYNPKPSSKINENVQQEKSSQRKRTCAIL